MPINLSSPAPWPPCITRRGKMLWKTRWKVIWGPDAGGSGVLCQLGRFPEIRCIGSVFSPYSVRIQAVFKPYALRTYTARGGFVNHSLRTDADRLGRAGPDVAIRSKTRPSGKHFFRRVKNAGHNSCGMILCIHLDADPAGKLRNAQGCLTACAGTHQTGEFQT